MNATPTTEPVVLAPSAIDELIATLHDAGYLVHGPVVRDDTVRLGVIATRADLARGARLDTGPGVSQATATGDDRFFGAVVGPDSARRYLVPPRARVVTTTVGPAGWDVRPEPADDTPLAILGVRPCDLAAIAVQDRVYLDAPIPDATYAAQRDRLLLVAVECGESAQTCFCASMGTGPGVTGQGTTADLILTELLDEPHRFLARAGTERGQELLDGLTSTPASPADERAAAAVTEHAAAQQVRRMRPDARDVLADAPEHPHWDEVAQRCLTCGNCTLVCPTCFCTTVEDHTDLTGDVAERWRRWDSCFTTAFTHTAAGSIRASARSRYRQWLTHKLSTWHDQFGTSGCVGCGRCIVWCPVGIDLTAEVEAFAQEDGS